MNPSRLIRLKDLQGIICDCVELNWQDDGRSVTKEFDDYGDELNVMYDLYGETPVNSLYAMSDDQERSWLCIHIEKPKIYIKDPVTLYIEKHTGETEKGVPMVSRYSLNVDKKAHAYLINNMDCQAETVAKMCGGFVMSKTYYVRYDGRIADQSNRRSVE